MRDWRSLSHVRWDCKYHAVFVPRYRKKPLYGNIRKHIDEILRELCRRKGVELPEGHSMPDLIQLCLSITPKYSVAQLTGFLKGKSAVRIHRGLPGRRNMTGLHFWTAG